MFLTGYDLFKPRHYFDAINYETIASKYGITIPPILQLFNSSFEWKLYDYKNLNFYFYPYLDFGDIQFLPHNLDEMINLSINSGDDDIIDNGLINLAYGWKGIYIGTIGSQCDKIILNDSGDLKVISENIFTFFRGVTNNLVKTARSKKEYMEFMSIIGIEGEDLIREGEDWMKYNK